MKRRRFFQVALGALVFPAVSVVRGQSVCTNPYLTDEYKERLRRGVCHRPKNYRPLSNQGISGDSIICGNEEALTWETQSVKKS